MKQIRFVTNQTRHYFRTLTDYEKFVQQSP
jgi:hypothetical protein